MPVRGLAPPKTPGAGRWPDRLRRKGIGPRVRGGVGRYRLGGTAMGDPRPEDGTGVPAQVLRGLYAVAQAHPRTPDRAGFGAG